MKHLFSCLKSYTAEAILAPLFKLLEASLELVVPLVVGAIVNNGIGGNDKSYIVWGCVLLVAFGAVGLAFSLTAQYFAARAAVGVSSKLRENLFVKLQSFSYAQIDETGTATMITRRRHTTPPPPPPRSPTSRRRSCRSDLIRSCRFFSIYVKTDRFLFKP